MKKIGVLGYPLSHSLSPVMHEAALSHYAIKMEFMKWELSENELSNFFNTLKENNILGGCVTVPYKETVMQYMDHTDHDVESIGAMNWFKLHDGQIKGFNTDHLGFSKCIPQEILTNLENLKVLLLGAGGSAKAVLHSLISSKCKSISIVNRTLDNAISLCEKYSNSKHSEYCSAFSLNDPILKQIVLNADLIINTTSVGMSSGPAPQNAIIDSFSVKSSVVAIDLVYSPLMTPFLKHIRNQNGFTINGLPMLIHQGIFGLNLITGIHCPFEIMEKSIQTELESQ